MRRDHIPASMDSEVLLREVKEEDIPIFFEQQLDAEGYYTTAFVSKNPADKEAYIEGWMEIKDGEGFNAKTVVCGGQIAGYIIKYLRSDLTEIGYWLGEEFRGKGVATKALAEFLKIMTTRPLYARAAKDNVASIRLLEKRGFVMSGEEKIFSPVRGEEVEEVVLRLNEATMKLAHVLFMDMVGYSKLPIETQTEFSNTLRAIVRGTETVMQTTSQDQLIRLFTGDGMALVFFDKPLAPVHCALEICQALKEHPEIELRMGIHSGLVEQIVDVNDKTNVAGGGINMAQRVMDCGDAGHILLSKRVAEDLSQYNRWTPFLHDLGEVEVKHNTRIHIFNLHSPGEFGTPELPEKLKKNKPLSNSSYKILAAAGVFILLSLVVLYAGNFFGWSDAQAKTDADFVKVFDKKIGSWIEVVFLTQAANGGIRETPLSEEYTVQVWATAQCLTAVLSTRKNLELYVPKIKNAFNFIESLRRTDPGEGWNYYGDGAPYTITEIGSWVTLAHIKSLESHTKIWDEAEKEEILNRTLRDLSDLSRRQSADGGWRPIRNEGPGFTRTYSTALALWSFVEAKRSPVVSEKIGNQYDETIRRGINWLLRTRKENQGWAQNPNKSAQERRYDGLIAQTLFVLSRAETTEGFGYLGTDSRYTDAKREFIRNTQLINYSMEDNNSDTDVRYPGTEFMAESLTFLWFPWSLAELTQLSFDKSLTEAERESATRLRLSILNKHSGELDSYVEQAKYIFILGENMFCANFYVNAFNGEK